MPVSSFTHRSLAAVTPVGVLGPICARYGYSSANESMFGQNDVERSRQLTLTRGPETQLLIVLAGIRHLRGAAGEATTRRFAARGAMLPGSFWFVQRVVGA